MSLSREVHYYQKNIKDTEKDLKDKKWVILKKVKTFPCGIVLEGLKAKLNVP